MGFTLRDVYWIVQSTARIYIYQYISKLTSYGIFSKLLEKSQATDYVWCEINITENAANYPVLLIGPPKSFQMTERDKVKAFDRSS